MHVALQDTKLANKGVVGYLEKKCSSEALWVRQVEMKFVLVLVKIDAPVVHLRSTCSPDMKTVQVYSGQNSHIKGIIFL